MNQLLLFFAGEWGMLRFLAGFIIVPLLYLQDRADIHKDFANHAKALNDHAESLSQDRILALRSRLYLFELEWWFVAAITVLFVAVFFMGSVARLSRRFDNYHDQKQPPALLHLADADETIANAPRRQVEGLLNAFGFALALTAIFCIKWAKAEAYREIQEHWFAQATDKRNPP